ncbi:MAG: hypothetical protein ABW252_12975 [Polyangiales bacterium]
MSDEATSKQLSNAHELFLLIPLKRGFVEQTERLTSYATRLRATLALLFAPTQRANERTLMPTANTIDRLQNLYGFHYGVVDRMQDAKLILGATFDSSWEMYFHNLVDTAGPFLDAIFCHCQGFEGRTCADGYESFAEFVRENQVEAGIFYSATPDLTADDLRKLRRVARGESLDEPLARIEDEVLADKRAWRDAQRARRGDAFDADYNEGLSRFVASLWELRRLYPDSERIGARTAQRIFDEAVRQMLQSYVVKGQDVLRLLPQGADAWWEGLVDSKVASLPTAVPEPVVLDGKQLANIQGNILEPYERVRHSALALMQLPVERSARTTLLRSLAERVTTMTRASERVRVNVALTHRGLARIGLDEAALALFPKEFREGMSARAGLLGDVGFPNHPLDWERLPINWPTPSGRAATVETFAVDEVDLVLSVQAHKEYAAGDHLWSDKHPLHDEVCELLRGLGVAPAVPSGARVLRIEVLRRTSMDPFDHPGLPRHESQPEPHASWEGKALREAGQARYDNRVALGELLLGHPDKRAQVARCSDAARNPEWAELFRDGTFAVVRKLRQDLRALDQLLIESAASSSESDKRRVHGLLLGRCPATGRSLDAPAGATDPGNDFTYAADPRGERCPLYAHARRTNPRDGGALRHARADERRAPVPRIMRRGFSYGSDFDSARPDHDDRGHFFVCFNASIAEQFEVIQRWINGGNATGLLSTQPDLLASTRTVHGGIRYAAPKDACPSGGLKAPTSPLASLSWGMYLFVPSRRALALLADVREGALPTSDLERERAARRGDRVLRELDAMASPALARLAYQQLLEEHPHLDDAADVWTAIRASGGTRETPYGLLVGDLDTARRVLGDSGRAFSVRTYWKRMSATMGEHYLGLDPEGAGQAAAHDALEDGRFEERLHTARHRELAPRANQILREHVSGSAAFDAAFAATRARFDAMQPVLDLRDLGKLVVGDLATAWVGAPSAAGESDDALKALVEGYIFVSRYCFFPYPEPWLERAALKAGAMLRAGYAEPALRETTFARRLAETGYDPAWIPAAMLGALIGFVPPTVSLIVSVLGQWLDNGTLARFAPAIRGMDAAGTRALLLAPLIETMRKTPVPPLVHRTALAGNGLTAPGNVVVVSLSSACIDATARGEKPEGAWLFGGENRVFDPSGTTHGCPMREPALQAILGVIAAVAQLLPLEKENPIRYLRT